MSIVHVPNVMFVRVYVYILFACIQIHVGIVLKAGSHLVFFRKALSHRRGVEFLIYPEQPSYKRTLKTSTLKVE